MFINSTTHINDSFSQRGESVATKFPSPFLYSCISTLQLIFYMPCMSHRQPDFQDRLPSYIKRKQYFIRLTLSFLLERKTIWPWVCLWKQWISHWKSVSMILSLTVCKNRNSIQRMSFLSIPYSHRTPAYRNVLQIRKHRERRTANSKCKLLKQIVR